MSYSDLDDALCSACCEQDIKKVMKAVSNGANVNAIIKGWTEITPLGWACLERGKKEGDYKYNAGVAIVKYLLDNGADPNIGFRTPLELHLHYGHDNVKYNVAELLVQAGADVLPYIDQVINDKKMLDILMSSPLYSARKHAKVSKVYRTTPQSAGIADTLVYRPIHPSNSCPYDALCSEFISSLKLPSNYFEVKYDMCYCEDCHKSRGDKDRYTRGDPPETYAIPIGWCRFALKQRSHPEASSKWHRAFHGTKVASLEKILEVGELAPAGRLVAGNKEIAELDGHYNDDWNPTGNSTKQIFVTPSPKYILPYSSPVRFESQTGQAYLARVAFLVLIRPGCYKVIPETMGFRAKNEICDKRFANEQLEWCTKEQGSTILSGLLVKISKK